MFSFVISLWKVGRSGNTQCLWMFHGILEADAFFLFRECCMAISWIFLWPALRGPAEILFISRDACSDFVLVFYGALRKGPPFHGSRNSRIESASCQMGGHEVAR